MKNNESNRAWGISFVGLLTVAFIVLKLIRAIEWSWWWVLSPIWIAVALAVVVSIVTVVIAALRS